MNVWLDDVRLPPPGWVHVKTVPGAQAHLKTGRVEKLSLDHDLDWHATVGLPPLVETGYDLVVWMVSTGHWPKHKPVVHSANPVGRARMVQTIELHWPLRRARP